MSSGLCVAIQLRGQLTLTLTLTLVLPLPLTLTLTTDPSPSPNPDPNPNQAQNEQLRQQVAALQPLSGRVRPDAPEADAEEGPPPARRPRLTIEIDIDR